MATVAGVALTDNYTSTFTTGPEPDRPAGPAVRGRPSTTVVDRRSGAGSHVCGSGSEVHGIDVVFAIGTSAADAQRRAILARAGG